MGGAHSASLQSGVFPHSFLTGQVTGQQIVARIKDLQEENNSLKNHTYIGHRGSKIDLELEKYVNTKMPERGGVKIMFLRESEGVYQFGSRRVHIKIEKGNQLLVRVGGGFIAIDDFVKQFTASEVEKIERRDVVNRFQ